jgi:hypothetical protein
MTQLGQSLYSHRRGDPSVLRSRQRKGADGGISFPAYMRLQSAAETLVLDDDLVVAGDNAVALPKLPDASFDLVYLDPPFNTGRAQARRTLSVHADGAGDRVGFGGRRYRSRLLRSLSYDDAFSDYLGFLEPRLSRARELLAPHGTLYFHVDYTRRITASCCWTSCSGVTRSSTS